uniref:LIM zinc-binding domain-containing protein n=1 Tax=Meloidogyne incognita TaxID=6306 RepID=A0A914N5N6_MELIC
MEIKIPIQLIGPLPGQTNFGPKSSYSPTPSPINSFIKQTSQQTTFNHRQSPLLQQQQQQQQQSSSSSQQLINDPKRYIHAYATQTPVATLMTGQNGGGIRGENNFGRENEFMTSNGSGGGCGGIHLRKQNVDNFVKELRDQGLTERQRVANQQQKPVNYSTSEPPPSLQNFVSYKQKIINSNLKEENNKEEDSVDQLIKEMEWKMRSGYGAAGENYCTKCRQQISGDPPGVTALGQPYHVTCFCCDQCQKQLAGCSFYAVDGKNLCQVDYMNSLEKCGKCKMPITQTFLAFYLKILRALGKAFHPECFVCPTCQKSLDGIQFTVDSENSAYCLDCFHERFSPRCASCLKVIAPSGNETEVARVIAMDRSYHLDCYKCEDCGLKLNSKIEGQGCYPLESHLFCKNCNLKRLKLVK